MGTKGSGTGVEQQSSGTPSSTNLCKDTAKQIQPILNKPTRVKLGQASR